MKMTKQSSLSTTFWAVAAAAAVAILSFRFHQTLGTHFRDKAETDSTICLEQDSNADESGEVRDSSEETVMAASPRETSAEEMPTEKTKDVTKTTESPPSTPVRPTSAKGKKWRDRLSAKKQLKQKQHQKNQDSSLPVE